jgi:hypothetical protein
MKGLERENSSGFWVIPINVSVIRVSHWKITLGVSVEEDLGRELHWGLSYTSGAILDTCLESSPLYRFELCFLTLDSLNID